MPKRDERKTAGYLLPEVIDGYPLKSMCFDIPDCPEYRQAFWGQVWQLARWWTWEKSFEPGDTRAAQAADYWRPILFANQQRDNTGVGCTTMAVTDIRQNLELCVWEVEYDNSGEWTPIGAIYQPACSPTIPEPNPTALLRVEDCQLQVSYDEAESYADIPGADWYRRDVTCPADAFWARSADPYVLGELADGTDIFSTRQISGYIENRAVNRNMVTKWGTGSLDYVVHDSSGNVLILQQPTMPAGTWGRLSVQARANNQHVLRLDPPAAPTVPLIQVGRVVGNLQHVMQVGTGTTTAQRLTMAGGMELLTDLRFLDYSNSTSRLDTARIIAQRENPAQANYHGSMELRVTDFVSTKVAMSLGSNTDGTAATIGVLGATRQPRQTLTGDWQGNEAGKNLAQIMASFGWIVDSSTLGVPPDGGECECDPNAPEFIEARRCQIAAGTMYLMLFDYYNQAIALINTLILCNSLDLAMYMRAALPFYRADGDAFYTYFLGMCTAISNSEINQNDHLQRVKDAYDQIAQLYYCALENNASLTINSWSQFRFNVGILLGEPDATHFDTWLSNFPISAMAELNANGYFYGADLPCEFAPCNESEWGMQWQFSLNSGSVDWTVTGANYTSFQGWVQNSSAVPVVMTLSKRVTAARITAACNPEDFMTIELIDVATGAQLASESRISNNVQYEIDYLMVGAEGIDGIQIKLSTNDNAPGGGTFARVLIACVLGNATAPTSGNVVPTCW